MLHLGMSQQGIVSRKYNPGMMTFNGTDAYYAKAYTAAGNKFTTIIRVNRASFTGDTIEYIHRTGLTATAPKKNLMLVVSSDATGIFEPLRDRLWVTVENAAATANLCRLGSNVDICDGLDHLIFFSFDGDAGTAMLYVDGVDADDTGWVSRIAPTTGTLLAGSIDAYVGGLTAGAGGFWLDGDIGYFGHREAYLTNPTDFYHPVNGLQQLDESGWTEWGAQPLFWNQYGQMTDNKGSAGNMTANGTITGPS